MNREVVCEALRPNCFVVFPTDDTVTAKDTADLARLLTRVQKVETFFDLVEVAFRGSFDWINDADLKYLARHCHGRTPRLRRNVFPRDFEWVLRLVTPDDLALRWIAKQSGLSLRKVESALDLLWIEEADAMKLKLGFGKWFYQPWNRHERTDYAGTIYTGRPDDAKTTGRWFVCYSDRPSKMGSDLYCCHIEARINGAAALRRLGIESVRDLVQFDHRAFWKKHFCLKIIDLSRLGRWHQNKYAGTRRQKRGQVTYLNSTKRRCRYDHDCRRGGVVYRGAQYAAGIEYFLSSQSFIAAYGRGRFIDTIDASHILSDDCET